MVLGGIPARAGDTAGTSLHNEHLRVILTSNGSLQQIENLAADESYAIETDAFTLVTDRGTLSNRDEKPTRSTASAGGAVYAFPRSGCCEVTLTYRLQPGRRYLERHLSVTNNGPERLLLEGIELGRTVFATAPREAVRYDAFWHAPTASFLRWEKGGLFAGIENPFFETAIRDREVAFSFEPALWIKPGETYHSEPQFLGAYRHSGRMIADHWPRTVASSREGTNRPRFRNPCGHVPLDWNEVQGLRQFALDYLAPRQDRFLSILYMYWYPLEQLPDNPELETRYKRVIDNFHALSGDLIIFNPLVRYERPTGDTASFWNVAPEGSTAQRILRHADDQGVKYGFYMGVAAQGDRGNACNLPFVPEKPEWKRLGPLGGVSGENCLACDEFGQWWYAVQRNTIARHNLHLWSWDPGPGHGLFCYSDQHGHVPGKGGYKGWRNSTELLRQLKAEFPDLYLMAYYGRKEYGLWGFQNFDQHESYWEQTIFYGASVHADLHDDRVNADGARLQSWWNENFRFLPTVMNHALTHRIGEHSYDARLPKVWDHGGWRYSLMSGIASSGSVTACILPEDVGLVPGLQEFYNRWLGWARQNFAYVKYNVALGDQVRPGGVDVWARINGDRGFLFLCNPAPRPARKELALDEQLGLSRPGQYTLQELHPQDRVDWFDPVSRRSVFAAGETVTVEVPAFEVLLLELAPATPEEANCGRAARLDERPLESGGSRPSSPHPGVPGRGSDRSDSGRATLTVNSGPVAPPVARMLDDWRAEDGQPFSFPFHAASAQLALRTTFHADPAIQAALVAATPANLAEVAPLVEQWRHDRRLPHSYAWARPDRLWFVVPLTDAGRVREVLLECNGVGVAVNCFTVHEAKIIYYADLTHVVQWGRENALTLRLSDLQANQFLGPYLDYPPTPSTGPLEGGRESFSVDDLPHGESPDRKRLPTPWTAPGPRVVYDRPVDPDMPARWTSVGVAGERSPAVLSATMSPPLVGGTPEIVFKAAVDLPPEALQGRLPLRRLAGGRCTHDLRRRRPGVGFSLPHAGAVPDPGRPHRACLGRRQERPFRSGTFVPGEVELGWVLAGTSGCGPGQPLAGSPRRRRGGSDGVQRSARREPGARATCPGHRSGRAPRTDRGGRPTTPHAARQDAGGLGLPGQPDAAGRQRAVDREIG